MNETFLQIRPGDRVMIRTPLGFELTGRAQRLLCNPAAGTVVLDMGGPYGTPGVCTPENFVRVVKRAAR